MKSLVLSLPWELLLLLKVFVGNVVAAALLHKISGLPSRARRFAWQFFFLAFFSLGVAWLTDGIDLSLSFATVCGIGVLNSGAAYAMWRAYAINLSKAAMFSLADDLIAMALGGIFLGELLSLSGATAIGIAVCLLSALAISSAQVHPTSDAERTNTFSLYTWVAIYSVIWGGAIFSMRVFSSVKQMNDYTFLAAWYIGSFLGSLLIYRFVGESERGPVLALKEIGGVFLFSICIWITLYLAYHLYATAPITVLQPIFQIAELVFPVLVGILVFGEGKNLSKRERLGMALGIIGGVEIVLSLR